MKQSLKEKLDRNIWITRKCRIHASERLLSHAKFIEALNVYYSVFVIILSLVSLTRQDNILSLISLALSIALTISIIYANSTGCRERSFALKQNYIDLQMLLDQLSYIDADDQESVIGVSAKYAELLKSSENHVPIDLYQVKVGASDPDMGLSKAERCRYYCQFAWGYLWRGVSFLLPLAVVILYFVLG